MLGFLKPAPDAEQKISEEKVPRLYKIWQTRVLISTAMVYIGYYIIRLIFTVQQNDISKAYGFSMGQIGTILSMFGIGYGISKLIMGTLADRANPNRYVATGLIVSSIINALYGTTQSFGMIVFLMLLNSVMQGMGAAACQRLVGLWFGRKGKAQLWRVERHFPSGHRLTMQERSCVWLSLIYLLCFSALRFNGVLDSINCLDYHCCYRIISWL